MDPVDTTTHAVIESKPIWKSLTFWFNLLAGLAAGLDWLANQHFGFVTAPWYGALVGLVNIALRFKSQIPVTLTGGDPTAVPRTQG